MQHLSSNRSNGAGRLWGPMAIAVCFLACGASSASSPDSPAQSAFTTSSSASPGQAVPQREQASTGSAWSTVQKLVQTFQCSINTSQSSVKTGQYSAKAGFDKLSRADDLIDYNQIAMRSLGKADWQSLSAGQKQELTATIETLVQNRYYPRWRKIFGKGNVTYVSQCLRNGDIFVSTNLYLGHKDEPLNWQLTSPQLKVVSLAVNQNDLLTRLRQRIQAYQARGGYAAMIAWLKSHSKCDIADGDTQAAKARTLTTLKTSARSIDLVD